MRIKNAKIKNCASYFIILLPVIIIFNILPFKSDSVTTVLLIRHAEKNPQGTDPPLSIEGQNRAQSLIHVAGNAGITKIYASQYLRTQQTVQPIADHLNLSVNLVNANDTGELVQRILSDHKGEVVLIAGHSNTIPQIIKELDGDPIPPILENTYDNIFVITISKCRKTKVINLKYSDPS